MLNYLISNQNTESESYMIRSLGAANKAINVTPVKFDDNSSDELIKTLSKDNSLQNLLVKAIVYLKNNIDSAHEVIEYLIGENEFLIDGLAEHELSYENKQILRQVLMANKNILKLDYKSSLIELKNLSRDLWMLSVTENTKPVDDNKRIDFKDYIDFPMTPYGEVCGRFMPNTVKRKDKYCDYSYPYKTVGAYKLAKQYPSGKDVRPKKFDFRNFCGHGTNLNAVILAAINCNLQLVPGIKQIKLQGELLNSGESRGLTHLNSNYVSTVDFESDFSDYYYVMYYAESSSDKFIQHSSHYTFASFIPAVVIGEGVGCKQAIYSIIKDEVGYKRLNIRILALQNKDDMVDAARILAKINNPDIMQVKLCTFDDLKMNLKNRGSCPHKSPDVRALWNQSSTLEELCARDVDSVAKDLSLIS